MGKYTKYLLLAFLIENLCTSTTMLYKYTTPVFYALLAIGVVMFLMPGNWNSESRGKFRWAMGLSFIYAFHCFAVGLEYLNQENLIYLGAKVSTFFIIIYSLNADFDFYETKALNIFAIIASLFLIYGLVFAPGDVVFDGEQRSAFGFVNSNTMSGVGLVIFGAFLCEYKNKKWDKIPLALCCLAAFGILASGSRAGIVAAGLIYISQYGLKAKSLIIVIVAAIVAIVILPMMDIELAGIERMKETVSGELGNNRIDERAATIMMIEERPLTGWGLAAKIQGKAADLTMMGSHNSFLDLAKTMGIPLAIVWVIIVLKVIVKYWFAYRRGQVPMDFYAAYALCTMFRGAYEAMFAGVHEINTNFFFLSLAILSTRLYNNSHAICK